MAKAPVQIGVASETKAFRQGIETGVIKPLEDAEDTLKEFGKAGNKSGDQLEAAMKDAQRETNDTRADLERLSDSVEQSAAKARRLGDGFKAGADDAGEAVSELGDEAKQNLSETVSSFRGDLEDIPQLIQDTFGGVVSSLGPAGLALGTAGAAGIGLIMGALEEAKQKEQEFRENVSELATVLIETGGEGSEAISAVADKLKELAAPTDEGAMSLQKIREQAKKGEIDFAELANAYAGAGGDLSKYIEKVDALADAEQDRTEKLKEGTGIRVPSYVKEVAAIESVSEELRDLAKEQEAAAEAERLWHESGAVALEARSVQMDTLQGELDDAIGSWTEYSDAEKKSTDPEGYLKNMRRRMRATNAFNENVQELAAAFGLSFEEQQAILDQGVDFAPMLQAIMDGGPEMQEQYATQIKSMLNGGQSIVDGQPMTVNVNAETGDAEKQLTKVSTQKRTAPIEAKSSTVKAHKQLDTFTDKKRTATVDVKLDLRQADKQLDDWIKRRRETVVDINTRTGKAVR